jgi:predicted small lipoprotein YifL
MIRLLSTAALLALLTGCGDGQPFEFEGEETTDAGDDTTPDAPDDDDGFDGDIEVPPGTTNPTPDDSIVRFEPEGEAGGGFVRTVSYNAAAQSFTVDNLAFDGVGPYQPNDSPDTLGGYAVFESDRTVTDRVNGEEVDQLDYRAIYGVSTNRTTVDGERLPVSRFAIVRSGDFTGYGFGGFLYERNGGMELPTRRDGQAVFVGDYAGLRVFDGRGGQELTEAKMSLAVDFTDFNSSEGVDGVLYDRRAYTRDGADIVVNRSGSRREDAPGTAVLDLPVARFTLATGSVTDDGEILGSISSRVAVDGRVQDYEDGTYYGIIGGDLDTGGEVVGVLVMTSNDPRYDGVTAQETGGFILYRDANR